MDGHVKGDFQLRLEELVGNRIDEVSGYQFEASVVEVEDGEL